MSPNIRSNPKNPENRHQRKSRSDTHKSQMEGAEDKIKGELQRDMVKELAARGEPGWNTQKPRRRSYAGPE